MDVRLGGGVRGPGREREGTERSEGSVGKTSHRLISLMSVGKKLQTEKKQNTEESGGRELWRERRMVGEREGGRVRRVEADWV